MYLTKEGIEKLKSELGQLVDEKRTALIKRVARARDFGDLSENSEYTNAREELSLTEQRISELEEVIKSSVVIKKSKKGNSVVKLGNSVTVGINGIQKTYVIVGEMEADPLNNKISASSPIGKALLGKKKGDKFDVETPGGKAVYAIKKIS